ncbi:hypothetical protein B5P44_08655 [Mycobacterium sp. CBMA 213]|nr:MULTISPECIES: nuclear transport factor 2 family protein [unclassified Mycolicibacterium]MUM04848.1 hypothetical protein [Mycolicibacterium sp. CBMA 213]
MAEICSAIVDHDVERVMDHFADDCVVVNGAAGTVNDKSAIRAGFGEMWAVFPDWTPRIAVSCLDGDTLGVLFDLAGTASGDRPVQWIGTGFYTFDPDTLKIVRDVYFADEASLEQKLAESDLVS